MTEKEREWRRRVAGWKASGLTLNEYSKQIGVKPKTLAWWKWRLSQLPAEVVEATFVEVTDVVVQSSKPRAEEVHVAIAGADVTVPVGFDEDTLARVLRVLEARR